MGTDHHRQGEAEGRQLVSKSHAALADGGATSRNPAPLSSQSLPRVCRRVFQGFGQALIFALGEVAEIRRTKMEAANLATSDEESDSPPICWADVDRAKRVGLRPPGARARPSDDLSVASDRSRTRLDARGEDAAASAAVRVTIQRKSVSWSLFAV